MKFNLSSCMFIFTLLLSPLTITRNFQNVFGLTPVADLTGTWSGFAQVSFTDTECWTNGKINGFFEQDGNNLYGEFTFVPTNGNPDCSYEAYDVVLEGTIDGSRLSLYDHSGISFSGWYASSGIKLDFSSEWSTGTAQLSPTGFTPKPVAPQDSDGDGMPDSKDACPDIAAPGTVNGCPQKDSDRDGIPDSKDQCRDEAAPGTVDGCPKKETTQEVDKTTDSDGDGVPDFRDLCEKEAAPGTVLGCPKESAQAAQSTQVDQNAEKALTDGLKQLMEKKIEPKVWAEGGVPIEGDTPELLRETAQTGGTPILQTQKVGNLKMNKGSATITTADGKIVNSNELKIGQTIQTGDKAGTNIQIGLEGGGTINLKENTRVSMTAVRISDGENIPTILDDEDFDPYFDLPKTKSEFLDSKIGIKQVLTTVGGGLAIGFFLPEILIVTGATLGVAVIGYTITDGSLYFETSVSNADRNPQAIVTPEGIFVHKKTEFTVTVDDETTKMYVIDGEVVFIPFDTSLPTTTVTSGSSISISDNKVEEATLDIASVDEWWEASAQESEQSKLGGCLIATAAFGSEMAPQVQFLREIRDNTVMSTQSGTSFMSAFNAFYYSFSPTVADLERQNPVFKEAVKLTITPLLSLLALLQYVDIDTEQEMLGYGIGIILLNIGIYFVGPAFLIVRLKNRFGKIHV